jgi:hypothetical protein
MRGSCSGPPLLVDVYHDRIGQTVRSFIDPDRRRSLHRRLAAELEKAQPTELEALALHFFAAGER